MALLLLLLLALLLVVVVVVVLLLLVEVLQLLRPEPRYLRPVLRLAA